MVAARPRLSGSDGWVRSRAWHWDFSSTHSTTAFCGGSKYSPTTSTSLASKRGSTDSLNVSTRHGRSPRPCQMPATVSLPTPWRSAIDLVVQCVAPPGGSAPSVSATTAATTASPIALGRPRPGRTLPTEATPSASKRDRHLRTVLVVAPERRAISALASPSPAHSNARAWRTTRYSTVCEHAITPNCSRCWADISNAGATITGTPNPNIDHYFTDRPLGAPVAAAPLG